MNAQDNGENWVVIGPFHVELGPAMVGNRSLTLSWKKTIPNLSPTPPSFQINIGITKNVITKACVVTITINK